MKFVSYNLQYGFGMDGKCDLERISLALKGADVIALQEVTRNYFGNGGIDMPAILSGYFPDYHHVFGVGSDLDAGSRIVGGRMEMHRFQFGNMILSRWPIQTTRSLLLPRKDRLDALNLQRVAVETVIVTPEGALRAYSVHLDHVDSEERMMQIRFLKARLFGYQNEGGAITGLKDYGSNELPKPAHFIVMGDLNLKPDSPEYGVLVQEDGALIDGYGHIVGYQPGDYSYRHPKGEHPDQWLDYCLVNAELAPAIKTAKVDNSAMGSDHFPLWLEIEGLPEPIVV